MRIRIHQILWIRIRIRHTINADPQKNHQFKLEFVDSGLYFDENNFINPMLQVGSGFGSNEKSNGSGWPKI